MWIKMGKFGNISPAGAFLAARALAGFVRDLKSGCLFYI